MKTTAAIDRLHGMAMNHQEEGNAEDEAVSRSVDSTESSQRTPTAASSEPNKRRYPEEAASESRKRRNPGPARAPEPAPRRRTPTRVAPRHENNSSSSSSSSNSDEGFFLLTPMEAGFPTLPRISAGSSSSSSPRLPPSVEYVGRVRSLLAPPPPPIAMLDDEDVEPVQFLSTNPQDHHHEEEDDLELASLFHATRRPLPSVKLQPRKSCQERLYHELDRGQDVWAATL